MVKWEYVIILFAEKNDEGYNLMKRFVCKKFDGCDFRFALTFH